MERQYNRFMVEEPLSFGNLRLRRGVLRRLQLLHNIGIALLVSLIPENEHHAHGYEEGQRSGELHDQSPYLLVRYDVQAPKPGHSSVERDTARAARR